MKKHVISLMLLLALSFNVNAQTIRVLIPGFSISERLYLDGQRNSSTTFKFQLAEAADVKFSVSEILLVDCYGMFLFIKNETTNTIVRDYLIDKGTNRLGTLALAAGNYTLSLSLYGTGNNYDSPSVKANLDPPVLTLGSGSATITAEAIDPYQALPPEEFTLNVGDTIAKSFVHTKKTTIGPDFFFTVTEPMAIISKIKDVVMNSNSIDKVYLKIYKESIFGELVSSLGYISSDTEVISPTVNISPGRYACLISSKSLDEAEVIPLSSSISIGKPLQILAILNISISAEPSSAPQVQYYYDLSGNCTGRNVIILQSSAKALEEERESMKSFEDKQVNVKIYPNPTRGWLKVEIPELENKETVMFSIYDMSGRLLKNQKTTESIVELDMSIYAAGTYILRMNRAGKYSSWRIIKIN